MLPTNMEEIRPDYSCPAPLSTYCYINRRIVPIEFTEYTKIVINILDPFFSELVQGIYVDSCEASLYCVGEQFRNIYLTIPR